MEQEKVDLNILVKNDKVAVWSFSLGVVSVFLGSSIGMIPLVAIILGIIGINNTKKEKTGRWIAISGLILGIIFLFGNAYVYNHLGFHNSGIEKNTPTLKRTTDLAVYLVGMKRISDEEFEISAEITNVSTKPIRAFKGTIYVDNIFNKYVTGFNVVRTDLLQPGEKFIVSGKVENYHSSSNETFNGYQDLIEAGSIENLKIKILVEEIIF